MSIKCKCAIIEDEPLAQNVLKKYIDEHPALELAGIFSDPLEAQSFLAQQDIRLLFLDINLPKLSGINFLKTIPHPPLVILTTAYPEFAVQGFELDVIDYLLKPFPFERFLKAVNKAWEKLNRMKNEETSSSFIFIKADKKVYKIDLDNILYIEATGDYLKIYTAENEYVTHSTLKNFLDELPPSLFLQVHKSFVIAKSKIFFIEGNYIRIADKDIPIGASYKEEVSRKLKSKNK
jgi:DNA-binding LytR/AlgR family response regulator